MRRRRQYHDMLTRRLPFPRWNRLLAGLLRPLLVTLAVSAAWWIVVSLLETFGLRTNEAEYFARTCSEVGGEIRPSFDRSDKAGNCWMPENWRLERRPGDDGFEAYILCLKRVPGGGSFARSRHCAAVADAAES